MGLAVREALTRYEEERLLVVIATGTLSRHVRVLSTLLQPVDISDQRGLNAAVAAFTARRRADGLADATIRRELITLRAAGRAAWRRGDIAAPPHVAVPPRSYVSQRALTVEEARALLDRLKGDTRLFVLIALATGARIGAILDLTWDKVDLDRHIIDLRPRNDALADRRKHRAVVPIGARLLGELRRAYDLRPDGPVVPRTSTSIARKIRAAAAKAGVDGRVTPHTLRHTVATWLMADLGIELVVASRLLGHRSTAITDDIYTHLTAERHLRPAANALEQLLMGVGPEDWERR